VACGACGLLWVAWAEPPLRARGSGSSRATTSTGGGPVASAEGTDRVQVTGFTGPIGGFSVLGMTIVFLVERGAQPVLDAGNIDLAHAAAEQLLTALTTPASDPD
jgi:hypothetical protein